MADKALDVPVLPKVPTPSNPSPQWQIPLLLKQALLCPTDGPLQGLVPHPGMLFLGGVRADSSPQLGFHSLDLMGSPIIPHHHPMTHFPSL